jgi:hypothetical protein
MSDAILFLRHPHFFSWHIIELVPFRMRLSSRAVGEGPACDPFECNLLRRLTGGSAALSLFRSLSRASHFSLLVPLRRIAARTAKPTRRASAQRESRKDNQKKAFPAHARSAWALSHPRADGAQAGVFAPVGRARRVAPGPRVPRGFSTGHPCPVEKRAASCRAPVGPDPRNPSRPGAPVDQDQSLFTDAVRTEKSRHLKRNSRVYLDPSPASAAAIRRRWRG